jgi:hypothetical protein
MDKYSRMKRTKFAFKLLRGSRIQRRKPYVYDWIGGIQRD